MNDKTKPFADALEDCLVKEDKPDAKLVNKGQYAEAYELLEDAEACHLTPILIGPPGTGKTMLARSFAASRGRVFEWMTFDDATKPVHLLGAFDPAETIRRGFTRESFLPGPLTEMMVFGGCFLANELNRATEFAQNTLLEPLEERSLVLPRLGRIKAHQDFFMICAANPGDMAGTHRISEALRDRIKVWIHLDYPTRAVELEIIEANVAESTLAANYLELTHDLIAATRDHREIERPASIRSAIAIAKLLGRKMDKDGKIGTTAIKQIAHQVLIGGIKPKPGVKPAPLVKKLIDTVLATS